MERKKDSNKNIPQTSPSSKVVPIPLYRLLFYEKPLVGNNTSAASRNKSISLPIQVYNMSGNFNIALPLQQDRIENITHDSLYIRGDAMVISGPEISSEDNLQRKSLINFFIFIAIVNLIITSLLYFNAHISDLSLVIPQSLAPNTVTFVQIPKDRRYSEKLIFSITFLNLIFGMIGALIQSPLALFVYSLIAILVFFFGFPIIPSLIYSTRYLFDAVNLYIAYTLRNKLMINILPFYFVRR